MEIPKFSIEISANAVAWYGAVVATISAGIGFYNAWKDRPRIKIKYETDQDMIGNPTLYPEDKKYLCITVTNKGTRPVKIDQAFVQQYNKIGYMILPDSFRDHRPKVIDEKSPKTTFATSQDQFDIDKIYRVIIVDGFGNKHVKYVKYFPTFPKLYYKLKRKFGVRDNIKTKSKKHN